MTARTVAPATYTIDEAATLLGVHRSMLYALRQRGERIAPDVPFLTVGRKCLVPRRALDALLGIDGEGA